MDHWLSSISKPIIMLTVFVLSWCFMYLIVQGNLWQEKNAPVNVCTGKVSADIFKAQL